MKLTFISEYTPQMEELGERVRSSFHEPVYPKITMEFEAVRLDAILSQFREFLLGCGFVIEGEIGELESPGTKAVDELREEYHQEGSEK